jgi:hypothetical protein
LIGTIATDHCNNVKKTVHKRFEGKFEDVTCSYFCFTHSEQSTLLEVEGDAGRMEHFKQNNGSDADMAYMLAMRNNIVQYVNLIDIYAPSIVGSAKWNDVDNMNQHCGDNVIMFQQQVLSISDEAFLLTVLYNYCANGMS